MKKVFLVLIISSFLGGFNLETAMCQNLNKLAEPLKSEIGMFNSTDFIPVLVKLTDQVNIEQLTYSMTSTNMRKLERSTTVISSLQSLASQSQGPLLGYLNQQGSLVNSVDPLWISNIIILNATKQVILELTLRSDVSLIYKNGEIEMDAPISGSVVTPGNLTDPTTPNLIAIHATELFDLGFSGNGSLVMSIDSGVDYEHEGLFEKWRGNNGYSSTESWYDPLFSSQMPTISGHGTHTMGTMVGSIPGFTFGVAPGAQWISALLVDSPNSTGYTLKCFQWALNPDNNINTSNDIPDVINCSFHDSGLNGYECYFTGGGYWDIIKAIEAVGTAVIFSAGNLGDDEATIQAPQNFPGIFTVGNLNTISSPFTIHPTSSRGPSSCDMVTIKPSIVAPGTEIYSSDYGVVNSQILNWGVATGTSMSSPHISGAIALLKSAFPDKTGIEIRDALVKSATPFGSPIPNNTYGAGLINVYAAYQLLLHPEKSITIHQKKSSGQDISNPYFERFDGTRFVITPNNSTIRAHEGTTEILAAAKTIEDNEKYNVWKEGDLETPNVVNHHVFQISQTSPSNFTSQFKPIVSASLQASADGVLTGAGLQIKDPWLRDYSEYGTTRNRGMEAVWTSLTTTNLSTAPVEGVFINTNPTPSNWSNKTFYQIKAPSPLSINGIQSQFLNWSIPSGTVEFQNVMTESETGIDFETAGAIVQANYKAMLASKTSGWVTGNQFVSENSTASVMYTSDGKLWLHRENGSDKKELLISSSAGSISGYSVAANGNNRYWVLNNGTTTPVCGHEINGVIGSSSVPALTGLTSSTRVEIVRLNSASPKLALITKIGSTIYKSIGTLTAGAVTWGSWTSLTVGPNAIQVAGNGNLAYFTWIQGSSIFGYKLKTDGTWSSAKVITTSSSGSFASMASSVDPNGNLNLILVRTNTQTGKKDLGEGAWYTTESTLPFTVLATSGTYGDFSAISLSCEGGKKLASVGVSTYAPNFSYYLWKHNGTEWIPEATAYGTTAQKLLQGEVDYRPSETAHSSGLKLMTQTAVDWPPQSATKVTTGASETPVLSISGVQLTDTLIYSAHLDPSMVDSILIDTLGVWTVAVKGDGFVTETVNDLKLFGTSELVVNRDEAGTRREIRFIPDLAKWDVWVVDPSGNKVRMSKSEAEETGGEEIRELVAVYPNPFNPETRISVRLTEAKELKVRVYNLVGQLVADLASGTYDRGDYAFRFDGRNLASGTYFYRVEIGTEVKTGKIQLLK